MSRGPERLGNVLERLEKPLASGVTTDRPRSLIAAGDVPIPLPVMLDPVLSWFQKAVYAVLWRFRVVTHSLDVYPSQRLIAAHLGVTVRWVKVALGKLQAREWVKIHHRAHGRCSVYELTETIPEQAWPDVHKAMLALAAVRRVLREGKDRSLREGKDRSPRTGNSTRGIPEVCTVLYVPPKEKQQLAELGRVMRLKKSRRVRRQKALDTFKEIVTKCRTKDQLQQVLTGIGMWPKTAQRLCEDFSLVRIRQVVAHLDIYVKSVTGFIREGLEQDWKFKR